MSWAIEPLNDRGLKVFYEQLNSSLFNGFDGTINTLVRNDKLGNPANEADQEARQLAAEKLKKLKKEIERHASVSEWKSNIFDNFLVLLAPGFSITAEKQRLILRPGFIWFPESRFIQNSFCLCVLYNLRKFYPTLYFLR